MRIDPAVRIAMALTCLALALPLEAEELPSSEGHETHRESAQRHDGPAPPVADPALPPGMTLAETLERAASEPPEDFPDPIIDDAVYAFLLVEQMEYRVPDDSSHEHVGWELQGWVGRDIDKFWWKQEGEWTPEDESGESETDLLYSRLITPFWSVQAGLRYANEWRDAEGEGDDYEDLVSGVLALQGLAPYMFEIDTSLAVSEDGDASLDFEAEYDLRLTQRLVLQPRLETALHFQDVPERELEAGVNDVTLDLRLRYEFSRRFAPYLGLRTQQLIGERRSQAEDEEEILALIGLRWAW